MSGLQYFISMFNGNQVSPKKLQDLIIECRTKRDIMNAPLWKQFINKTVSQMSLNLSEHSHFKSDNDVPLVSAGAIIHHNVFGKGQVVEIDVSFPNSQEKLITLPYLWSLPEEVKCLSQQTLIHERFGEGTIVAYRVVFTNSLGYLSYPRDFEQGQVSME